MPDRLKAPGSLRIRLLFFVLAASFFVVSGAKATHIVGAELYYRCVDNQTDRYQVTLRMLRDCFGGRAPFDDQINLFIFPSNNPNAYWIERIPQPLDTPRVVPEAWEPCVGNTNNPCIEEGYYRRVINIPDRLGGYDIAWARCCRNGNITNLQFPLTQGVTFLAHLPGPDEADCNNMPVFDREFPIFICAQEDYYFDHSATDPDGDSLVYSISTPYGGTNYMGLGVGNTQTSGLPAAVTSFNPMGPPPYVSVNYNAPFNGPSPFGPTSISTIDPQTGLLHFNPMVPGVYVVAISVKEYRNGVLLSENKRDFQIHVVQCLPLNPPPVISHDLSGLNHNGDTIIVDARQNFCYRVTVEDSIPTDDLEAEAISAIFGGNAGPPPAPTVTISGSNPLYADICWNPACEYVGQTVMLVLRARDIHDCPNYNNVFDTVWVRIEPPPPSVPVIGRDFGGLRYNGDTIIAGVDTAFCFDWWVNDTTSLSNGLSYTYQIRQLGGGSGIQPGWTEQTFPDSLHLRVCWTPGCDNRGKVYEILLFGYDESACRPDNDAFDRVYIRIPELQNPPPVISHDLSGNVFQGDTIFMDVHDTTCFGVVLEDTFPGILTATANIEALDGLGNEGAGLVVNQQRQPGSLTLNICWKSACVNEDRLFRVVIEGVQDNKCNLIQGVADTIYISVAGVVNPPPQIGHVFLPGYEVNGNTIVLAADSTACYNFFLRDPQSRTYLEYSFHSEFVPTGDSTGHDFDVQLTAQSDTLIAGRVCFTPGCEYVIQEMLLILAGKDTFDCNSANWVFDTVRLQIVEPYNRPPTIQHFLDGLEVSGNNVVSVPRQESYCYEIELADSDAAAGLTAEGSSYVFDLNFRFGNSAEITTSGTNPMYIDVCWDPSCYDSEEYFELVVCGRDTSRCALLPPVCDTVVFYVEPCTIEIQNVFSPNGDGINDRFVPYHAQGVEYYDLQIFDRWGRTMFTGDSQGWDGNHNGNFAPDGVYYYLVEFQFFSARGVPLKEQKVGWVTLLR